MARTRVESGRTFLEHWWSERFKLPTNHPLLQKLTNAELSQLIWEAMYERKAEIERQLDDDRTPRQQVAELYSQLARIQRALGEDVDCGDPLIDKWERELEQGIIPDLDEEL